MPVSTPMAPDATGAKPTLAREMRPFWASDQTPTTTRSREMKELLGNSATITEDRGAMAPTVPRKSTITATATSTTTTVKKSTSSLPRRPLKTFSRPLKFPGRMMPEPKASSVKSKEETMGKPTANPKGMLRINAKRT